jgi:hypothetical protein
LAAVERRCELFRLDRESSMGVVVESVMAAATAWGLIVGASGPDPCNSVTIPWVRAALQSIEAAEAAHGGGGPTMTFLYEGEVLLEDHLMRPGMTRAIPLQMEFVIDPASDAMRVREIVRPKESPQVETTLVVHGRVATQPSAAKPFVETASNERAGRISDLSQWLPASIARAARKAAATCRAGAMIEMGGRNVWPITFTDGSGHVLTALVDEAKRVVRVERLEAHQRLGDVCEWTQLDDWTLHGEASVPGRISRFVVRPASTMHVDLRLVSFEAGPVGSDVFAIPEALRGEVKDWGVAASPTAGMAFVALAPGLWSIEIDEADARVIVIEREADLVVLGAPDGDRVCAGLTAALEDRFPAKPIAVAAFGHHHPSPSGGLRALAATGATIVAPRGLEAYIKQLLARPTTLGAPAVAGRSDAKLELFDGEMTIDAGGNSVRLIDIAERSAHAFHYVVFYFPNTGILFEDDLGYFPLTQAARVGPRLTGLADALTERGVMPTRLIQLWPVKNVLPEVEWSTVEKMIAAERERKKTE